MMTEKIFVVPAAGCQVRDPVTLQALHELGAWKPRNTYWSRRVRCGDCIDKTAEQVTAQQERP